MQLAPDELISGVPLAGWSPSGKPTAGDLMAAKEFYLQTLKRFPHDPVAHNNLGLLQQLGGADAPAVDHYLRALHLDPHLRVARRNLAVLLVKLGRQEESLRFWHEELRDGPEGIEWLNALISTAMRDQDLALAGHYAAISSMLRWGSRWYPRVADSALAFPARGAPVFLTVPKLRHDIEQFEYLQQRGILGEDFTPTVEKYRETIARLSSLNPELRIPLDPEAERAIGHVYNRIVHVRTTPRLPEVFSGSWRAADVERDYLAGALGLVVVDDFLSRDALESLRLFCLESTVWSGNRYAHGRLGAFFYDGFNCPLLLQIAEGLRASLPRVIGARHPLRQMWGFKNQANLPPDSTNHADFAAVSVNLWITPDDANLDPSSGGLKVYNVDAPLSWNFDTYNGRQDVIKAFLNQQKASVLTIPYRQNRAIIFNADLFHATAGVKFRPGYENRRINVTMLYGDREADRHHPNIARQQPSASSHAWRSPAFHRARRRS